MEFILGIHSTPYLTYVLLFILVLLQLYGGRTAAG